VPRNSSRCRPPPEGGLCSRLWKRLRCKSGTYASQCRPVAKDRLDDKVVDRERPKPHQLLSDDGFQLFRWRRLLGRSEAIKANPRLSGGQFIGKGSLRGVSNRWPAGQPPNVADHRCRTGGVQKETEASSRRSEHLLGSAIGAPSPRETPSPSLDAPLGLSTRRLDALSATFASFA